MKANKYISIAIGLISILVMITVAYVVQTSLKESYIQYHYRTNELMNTDADIRTWTNRLHCLANMSWSFYIYPLFIIVTTISDVIRRDEKSYTRIVAMISMIFFTLSMGVALYMEMDIWIDSFGRIL